MKLPELKIGKLIAKVPIIQGGMAIRLSTARLAAAVANEGGIGLIAASGMPFEELRHEIRLARKLTPNGGIVGINVMVAARQFKELVAVAIEEGIDLVVAGAGFSRDMFSWGKESGTPIVPIVSSAKLAKISQTLGAAAIIVEGAEAGGHLGTNRSSREIVPEVRAAVKLPVIGAGGVLYGRDIMEMLKLGADGVQMGSRFAASVESNGSEELKKVYLRANKPEDFVLVHSPVGLPGQAIRTPFSERIMLDDAPKPKQCDVCLKKCSHKYCIIRALSRAQQGDVETGLVFSGKRMREIHDILPVKEIFANLKREVAAIPE
ncbi:nitronate monooxygenase family protein [Megasphaera lornae]|uniref:NAD(P)H-dependent flavin oxidoreductase n=1 Tax=Megasphaera lornae TaxID=1000568 RepID=UPI00159DD7D9|nr:MULTISPECIES: nitronate monooxygenase [Megasphaera]